MKKKKSLLPKLTKEELEKKLKKETAALKKLRRELEIESSLERMRVVAMSMHKSEELIAVCEAMYRELNLLGFANIRNAQIAIKNDAQQSYLVTEYSDYNKTILESAPYHSSPIVEELYNELEKSGNAFYQKEFSGKKFEEWRTWRKRISTTVDRRIDEANSMCFYLYSIGTGHLGISTFNAITTKQVEILKRFKNVFELSYQRYTDVANAEAQAREAKIEASLERVRAKAMAMHKSEDLNDAVGIVFEELDKLNLGMSRCGIGILDKEKRNADVYTTTISDQGTAVQVSGDESIDIHPLLQGAFDAWLKQADFSYVLQGEDLIQYYRAVGATNIRLPESQTEVRQQYYYFVPFQAGGLFAFRDMAFPEEAKKVMKRFANVFDLTYKRFLDIQKAETQAREAKIEAALERVRSRTMAMHKSDELLDVINVVSEQLLQLEFKFDNVSFSVNNKEYDVSFWMAIAGQPHPFRIHAPYLDNPILNHVRDAQEKGLQFFADTLTNEENAQWIQHVFEHTALVNFSEETKRYVLNSPGYARSTVILQNIILFIGNYAAIPYTDEQNTVFKRFANVFEQAYTRFLDLQRAESQAREAKIEVAMEKVRSRALAMQKPNELIEVAQLLGKEMSLLGVEELETSSIYICNQETGKTECWYAIKDVTLPEKELVSDHMTIDLNDTWVGRQMSAFYHSDKKQTSIPMQGANRKEWINYCADHSKVLAGFYGDNIPDRTYHLYKFSNGYIGAASPGDISAESWDLLQRATSVFSLAYTRFSDLQQAEASAKEAIRQASLDRIRAEIASMRTTTDLESITPLIWKELTILGVPFIRCGVFIMDESQKLIHTFLSAPDGKAIAAFHLPYDTPGNIAQVLHHWLHRKNYIDHWDESAFTEFAGILVKQQSLVSAEQYLQTIPRGGFYLHFLPFLQGMLYVGNTTQLGDDEIKLIQSVADAFSTAYARYEDFNKLEAAKQQVEKTLTDLKQAQTQLVQSEKMASLGELTAGIAHEIQNPLNFVNNFSEVSNELLEEMKEELAKGNYKDAMDIANDVKQNLEKINHHGRRADGIVKGMLQHSRSGSGQKELTDINVLADEYVRLCYHGLRAKDKSFNAVVKTDFDETIGKINIIPQDIGRVILNLLTNAFYAALLPSPAGGEFRDPDDKHEPTVWVTTKKVGDKVLISVRDNGPGIPPKVLDKIFQPFFTTKPTGQGTGLGLSLSYDIITKGHGGELKVETPPGGQAGKENKGSEFIMMLPAH